MDFDFDTPVNRHNTNSLKWEVGENELPMWVADMDFKTAPCVLKALEATVNRGVFGYGIVPDKWYNAYIGWWKIRHGFEIKKQWIIFCTGVIPAISSAVRKLTTPAENVLVMTPVYNIFFNSILNNGRNALECPLKYDGKRYSIDFEDLENKLSLPQTTLMLLCNPQNPSGNVWDMQTLARIGDLCKKHGVTVISDEIHCDLTDVGKSYTPFAAASETCKNISITCLAPTKAFNIAGLQTAAVVAPSEFLYNKINRALNTDEVAEPNVFAIDAAAVAFESGAGWLDALRGYIYENKRFVCDFIKNQIPTLSVTESDATYLLWINISGITNDSRAFADFLRKTTGLFLSDGHQYRGNGDSFVRMNVACPRAVIADGLERLKKGVNIFGK